MKNNSNLEFKKIKSLNFLYEINENGTIFRNVKSKKQLKIKLDVHCSKKGYYIAFVRFNGKATRVMVHKAVAECWLGSCPESLEVDHIDGNTHNNHYTNLRYISKNEQMKNRDRSKISAIGSKNLEIARENRMKPVIIYNDNEKYRFKSQAECARFLGQLYDEPSEKFRYRLKDKRSHIYDFNIVFLNAETRHGRSTEQGIVHESDLTGNYTTAFNAGKQQETVMRVRHDSNEIC